MTVGTCLAVLLLLAVPGPGAVEGQPVPSGPDVRVTGVSEKGFPEIAIQFEMVRPDGSFLRDARREEFRVAEEDREVPIVEFQAPVTTERMPTTLVLVVDRSGSMIEENRIGGLKRAVAAFLRRLPEGSRVAVVAFDTHVEVLSEFTTDLARVRDEVDDLRADGATRFYDAVARALEMLQDQPGRRAVLALTDGEDTDSQGADLGSLIDSAGRLGLPVYTLGLGSERDIRGEELRRLAEATRGRYYPARRADELRAIYEQIAERIGSTYLLTYRTDRPVPDGTLRPIRISYQGAAAAGAGRASVFIPGMVVPAGGWSSMFLALTAALAGLILAPRLVRGRRAWRSGGQPTRGGTLSG